MDADALLNGLKNRKLKKVPPVEKPPVEPVITSEVSAPADNSLDSNGISTSSGALSPLPILNSADSPAETFSTMSHDGPASSSTPRPRVSFHLDTIESNDDLPLTAGIENDPPPTNDTPQMMEKEEPNYVPAVHSSFKYHDVDVDVNNNTAVNYAMAYPGEQDPHSTDDSGNCWQTEGDANDNFYTLQPSDADKAVQDIGEFAPPDAEDSRYHEDETADFDHYYNDHPYQEDYPTESPYYNEHGDDANSEFFEESSIISDLPQISQCIQASTAPTGSIRNAGERPAQVPLLSKYTKDFPYLLYDSRGLTTQSIKSLVDAHYSLIQLRLAGVTVTDLREFRRHSALALRKAGYSAADVYDAGYTVQECKEGGYLTKHFIGTSVTVEELLSTGSPVSVLLKLGYSVVQLKNAGASLRSFLPPTRTTLLQVDNASEKKSDPTNHYYVPLSALVAAGYSGIELLGVGFTVAELRQHYLSTIQDLERNPVAEAQTHQFDAYYLRHTCGIDCARLKAAGCTLKELYDAGFSIDELLKVGVTFGDMVTEHDLTDGLHDFVLEIERRVLIEFYCATSKYTSGENENANGTVGSFAKPITPQRWNNSSHGHPLTVRFGDPTSSLGRSKRASSTLHKVANHRNQIDPSLSCWSVRTNWVHSDPSHFAKDGYVPVGEWFGVEVHPQTKRVVALQLNDNNLTGRLTPSLGYLHQLETLLLYGNNLEGEVPASIWTIPNLKYTNFSHNPELFCGQPCLDKLATTASISKGGEVHGKSSSLYGDLYRNVNVPTLHNSCRSPIPIGEKDASSCYSPKGSGSVLYGASPRDPPPYSHFTRAPNDYETTQKDCLMAFYQSTDGHKWLKKAGWCTHSRSTNNYHVQSNPNRLSQWFGVTVDGAGHVVKLCLPSNNITGVIPTCLFEGLIYLKQVDLRYNQLTGPIPLSLHHCVDMTHLYLHCNRFSGDIDKHLFKNMKRLQVLDLRSNQLIGHFPYEEMDQNTALTSINITSNRFTYNPLRQSKAKAVEFFVTQAATKRGGTRKWKESEVSTSGPTAVVQHMKSKLPWCRHIVI